MENMLTFLTRCIKARGMTVDTFIAKCTLTSRQRFYRFVKEPTRFSDEALEEIAEVLQLDAQQRSALLAFRSEQYTMSEDLIESINSIIFSDSTFDHDFSDYVFDLYLPNSGVSRHNVLTAARSIGGEVTDRLHKAKKEHNYSLSAVVFNCLSESVSAIIAKLLFEIRAEVCGITADESIISIMHQYPPQPTDIRSRLELYRITKPLRGMFADYCVVEREPEHPIWCSGNDICIIRLSAHASDSKNSVQRSFLLKFTNKTRVHVAELDSDYLYDYFTADARGAAPVSNDNIFIPMSVNMLLLKYSYEYEHMILCKDVCFDNIPLSAWKDTLDAADPKYLPQIAERLGVPSFRSTIGDKSPMFEQLLHYLDERAKVNDAKECSSLLFASGLAQLIKNRYPSSLALPVEISPKQCKPMGQLVPFTPKALTLVFDYIIERIADRRPGRQRFYIIKPVFEHDKPEMSFFRNQVLYTCDSARINKLAYVSAYRDVEVVNMLMDYIQHEVIDKRGTLTSLLMSDDEAVSFLSSLRNEVVEMHDLTR